MALEHPRLGDALERIAGPSNPLTGPWACEARSSTAFLFRWNQAVLGSEPTLAQVVAALAQIDAETAQAALEIQKVKGILAKLQGGHASVPEIQEALAWLMARAAKELTQ